MRVYILIPTKTVTKMTHIILHIVCWYPVLAGLIRLLVMPGGGSLAGIIVELFNAVEVILCLDHGKALEKIGRKVRIGYMRLKQRLLLLGIHSPSHYDREQDLSVAIQAGVKLRRARVSSCDEAYQTYQDKAYQTWQKTYEEVRHENEVP